MIQHLDRQSTVLLVPQNDAEAVQILQIATKLGIQTLVSSQPHGARLEHEPDLFERLRETGKDEVAVVEMPGPGAEEQLRKSGFTIHLIDHHRYDDVNRLTDSETGEPLPSSLEQFLIAFDITDDELKQHGFDPRLVRGVGAIDRGFIWALERDGYSEAEIKEVGKYVRGLARLARGEEKTRVNEEVALEAWQRRREVNGYIVVTSDEPGAEIRPVVSLLAAEEFGRPTPMVIASRGGLLIYVQESPRALDLFKKFGGFTFGQDSCWGYNNAISARKVAVDDVLKILQPES